MKKSDAAGFINADCTNTDLGKCNLEKAILEFKNAPWEKELKEFDKLDGKRPTPCWPDLTFRIGDYHIAFTLANCLGSFNVEVCTFRPKKILGFIAYPKFFEFKSISTDKALMYLTKFYELETELQYEYFKKENENS